MKYAYEDLSDNQFEKLVQAICRKLLGAGVQAFSTGPDGGRDAKFVGTAQKLPSESSPWNGIIVIQAKHTNGHNKKFSDTDFFSDESKTNEIAKELTQIKNLFESDALDYYLLFANRNLSALVNEKIVARIFKETGVPEESILLCGDEMIEAWLKDYPDIPGKISLDPVESPLIVSPEELAEIVVAIQQALGNLQPTDDPAPTPRIPYDEKNKINNLSAEYATEIRQRYLKYTAQIARFLSEPENELILEKYSGVVEEFQLKIIAKYSEFDNFDAVMNHLIDLLFARDVDLKRNKKLTRHY